METAIMAPTKFTLFPQLPQELRLKIWGIALTEPRVVHISCKRGIMDNKTRVTEHFLSFDPPHPILHTNQESRYEALNTYPLVPLFQTPVSDRYIYINFSTDVIHCAASVLEYLGPKEIAGMRKMILEVGDAAYFGHFHMETVMKMHNLEEIEMLTSQWKVFGWETNWREALLKRISNDFLGAKFEDPGWRCPRVRILDAKSMEEAGVIEGGALLEGWKIGDDYPEHLLP